VLIYGSSSNSSSGKCRNCRNHDLSGYKNTAANTEFGTAGLNLAKALRYLFYPLHQTTRPSAAGCSTPQGQATAAAHAQCGTATVAAAAAATAAVFVVALKAC
jgi:hypothetical protein